MGWRFRCRQRRRGLFPRAVPREGVRRLVRRPHPELHIDRSAARQPGPVEAGASEQGRVRREGEDRIRLRWRQGRLRSGGERGIRADGWRLRQGRDPDRPVERQRQTGLHRYEGPSRPEREDEHRRQDPGRPGGGQGLRVRVLEQPYEREAAEPVEGLPDCHCDDSGQAHGQGPPAGSAGPDRSRCGRSEHG